MTLKRKLSSFLIALIYTCIFSISVKAQEKPAALSDHFLVGCNYWASYAGTRMWRDWRPEIIEADFKQLHENGIKIIRVFPLWPDFQPIYRVYTSGGLKKYMAFKDDQPLPATGPGSDGVSEEQLQHFEALANLAQKYDIKLIVGLITGWMSGQLYAPPALQGKNLLSDPESLEWQQKFVRVFVTRFKNKPAIAAWDFGNECDVMEKLDNHHQAYVWAALLSGTIKSIDNTRTVISGMHGLTAADNGVWRISDQAATTDILTTHPYSLWTKYASQDPVNTIRTIMHAAAETRMCADIGGKPALTEETGVMGPMTGNETAKAAFANTALFSNWANDCTGTLWWCAYDQGSFAFPPYNYANVEAELGLIKEDRTPKPVMNEFKNFSHFIDGLPFKTLPQRKTDAVCILTEGQDNWAVAYSSFILAKQAGFDFQFQKAGQELKDAPLYLLPSVKSPTPLLKQHWLALLEKVQAGATLYISLDDTYLPTFNDPLGIELTVNEKRRGALNFKANLAGKAMNFKASAERKLTIDPKKAKVLGTEGIGNPAFIETRYGKGTIYLLTFPLEYNLTTETGSFDTTAPAYYKIYQTAAHNILQERLLTQDNPYVAVTEHPLNEQEKVIVLINYQAVDTEIKPLIKKGWQISSVLYGDQKQGKTLKIKANDAIVLSLKAVN